MLDWFKKATIEKDKQQGAVMLRSDEELKASDGMVLMEISAANGQIPIFKGKIKHLYESDFLGYKDRCPLCGAPTVLKMSNFPYATQEKARMLTGPYGYFCEQCPTVITDDDAIKAAMDPRFEFRGVFNVESGLNDGFSIVDTLNGEKPIFVIEGETENIEGVTQSVHFKRGDYPYYNPKTGEIFGGKLIPENIVNHNRNQKAKKKAKNKQAKMSKKANRRK